jgi:hypothetical protein
MSQSEIIKSVEQALANTGFTSGFLTLRDYNEKDFGNATLVYTEVDMAIFIRRDRGQYILDISKGDISYHVEDIYPDAKYLMENGIWTLEQLLTIIRNK